MSEFGPWNGFPGEVGGLVELAPEGRVDVGLGEHVAVAVAVERVLLRETEERLGVSMYCMLANYSLPCLDLRS